MRIRALDRWSAVSLATTAPSPVQGDPSLLPVGRPPRQLLSGIARLLEIAGVDLVEARRGKVDADQLDLRGEAPGDLRAHIALAIDPVALAVLAGAEELHPDDPGHCREPLGDAGSARLDSDDMAAAEDAPGQLGDGPGQHHPPAV